MGETVQTFIIKGDLDGSFTSACQKAGVQLGGLSKEAIKSKESIEKLLSGKLSGANIDFSSIFKDMMNAKDLDKFFINLEKKFQKMADKATKAGLNKFIVPEKEALEAIERLHDRHVFDNDDMEGIKEYIGYYERLVSLGSEGFKGSGKDVKWADIKDTIQTIKELVTEEGRFYDSQEESFINYTEFVENLRSAFGGIKVEIDSTTSAVDKETQSLIKLNNELKKTKAYKGNMELSYSLSDGEIDKGRGESYLTKTKYGRLRMDSRNPNTVKHSLSDSSDTIFHTHPQLPNLNNLRMSFDDIEQQITHKVSNSILMCGDEILKLQFDTSKVSPELLKTWKTTQKAIYASCGAMVNAFGEISKDGMSDEQLNKAANIWNTYISEQLKAIGGSLTTAVRDGDAFKDTTKQKIKGVSTSMRNTIKDTFEALSQFMYLGEGDVSTDVVSDEDIENFRRRIIELQKKHNVKPHPLSYATNEEISDALTKFGAGDIDGYNKALEAIKAKYTNIKNEEKEINTETEKQAENQEKVVEKTEQAVQAVEKEKETKKEVSEATKQQAEEQQKVAEEEKKSTEAVKKEKEAKNETVEKTKEQSAEQQKVAEETKQSAENTKEESSAKKEASDATKEQATEQQNITDKTIESIEATKAEKENKIEAKEATKEQAEEQKNVTSSTSESAEAAEREAEAQREAAKAVQDKATEIKNLGASIMANSKTREEIKKALDGSSIVTPTTMRDAEIELGRRARNFASWYNDRERESKPITGATRMVKYFKQLQANKSFLSSNGLDPELIKNSKFYIPQLDDEKLFNEQDDILRKRLSRINVELVKEKKRLVELKPELADVAKETEKAANATEKQVKAEEKAEKKTEQKAGDVLARIKKRKEAEKKALEQQKQKEKEEERKAEERAEKKAEQQMKLDEAKAKSRQDVRQKQLDNYAKWTGVNTGSKAKAIEKNKQLAEKQKEVVESAKQIEQAENSASEATSNLTTEQQAQIKVLEEQKEKQLEIIKVQEDWQRHLQPTLDDSRYKTKGKKEATERLRNATRHLVSVRNNPEDYSGSSYSKELASIRWWKSWEEAQKQGVAQRTLTQNRTDLADGHAVNDYIDEMQKELEFHLNVLAESKNKVAQIEQQIQDIANGKTVGTTELPQEPEIKTTFSNLIEQARTQIDQIMNQEIQTMTSEFMEGNLRTQGQRQFTQLIEQARTQIDEVMNNAVQEYMKELSGRVLNSRLALPEMSSETARKSALLTGNKEAWDKSTEEYNREMEQFYENQAKQQAEEMREAQLKSVENAYRKLTGNGRTTTYKVNTSKDVRTALQNQMVDKYETDEASAEKLYEESAKLFAKDQAAMERINAARQSWLDAMDKGAEYVQQSQEQADAQAAEKAAEKAEQQAQKEAEKAAQQQQRRKNKSSKAISSRQIKEAEKYVESVKDVNLTGDDEKISTFYAQINAIKEQLNSIKSVDLIDDNDTDQVKTLREQTEALAEALEKAKAAGKDVIDVSSTEKALNMQEKIGQLMQNANLSNDQYLQLSRYNEALKSGNVNAAEYDRIAKGFSNINSEVSKGNTLVDAIQHKFKNLAGYLISFMSFYRIIGTVKQMANTVREFDDAFTEMRKVSDESVETLKSYQKESYDLAMSVGTDALSLQKSTADYMRLGESLEEAKKSAQAANILLNVSEFKGIDEATESLIAMSAAYKDLDKMTIIDKLNKIGNDFAISTDGIATALKDSAAALTTAGNSIDESVALVTAANQTLQSPATAGKAIRTISLRLTGTKEAKKELEDEGEEIESFVETQSKLRETIKNATKTKSNNFMGFDILDDKGAYKSTYEIMLGIAKLYDEIVENDKKTGAKNMNLLLETLAGKNRAAAAASILQNASLLEDVYNESAFESANSAIIENEKYLESLSGKLAQLKTAWQELQTTIMDSGFLKGLTDFGTGALKGTTGLMNQLSPTSLLMTMAGGFMGLNGIGPVSFNRSGKMKSWFNVTKNAKAEELIGKVREAASASIADSDIVQNIDDIRLKALDLDSIFKDINLSENDRDLINGLKEQDATIGTLTARLNVNKTAWSQVKQVALGTLASMGVSFAASLGVDFVQKLAAAPKAIASAAASAGNTIKNETQSINEYKDKVQELWDVINDPNASIEEQTNARTELLNVQNELIANYGDEASLLTGVSSSADAAASSLEKLAEAQYRANMLAFKEGEGNGVIKNAANAVANVFQGFGVGAEGNYNRMIAEMEKRHAHGSIDNTAFTKNSEFQERLAKIFARNNISYDATLDDENQRQIKLAGTSRDMADALDEARNALEEYRVVLGDSSYNEFSEFLERQSRDVQDVISKYGELYDQSTYYETILNNTGYKEYYDNLQKYYDAYKEAFASGDQSAIDEAVANFTNEYNSALKVAGEDARNGEAVKSYFENLYSGMETAMGKYNFEDAFKNNLDGVKDAVSKYLGDIGNLSSEELLNFTMVDPNGEAEKAWSNLSDLADNYGLHMNQLIPILEEIGVVQSQSYTDLLNNFKDYEYQISNMSQEELQIAYKIYADGMSFEELHERIEQEKGLIEIGFDIHDRSGLEAYNEIASNQKSYHADYDQYRQMMEDAKKLREEGRIGEEQFKQAAKLFSENGMTDYKNWDENYKALSKYFTEGSAGAEAFAKDIVALGKEFATINEDGGIDLNLDNMGELAEKLHMPMEMLQVLLENLQSFGATPDYFGNMEDGQARLNELYKQRADTVAKIEQMEKDGTTGTAYEQAKQDLEDINKSINTVTEGMDNLVEDAKNFNKETSEQYQSNKTALQSLLNQYNDLNKNHKEDDSYQYQKQALEEAINAKSEEYNIPIKFEGDKASIDDSLKKADEKIQKAKDKLHAAKTKIEVDPSEVESAENELKQAIEEKQKLEEPAIMKVDTSQYNLDVDDAKAINKLQEFMEAWNELQSLKKQQELGIHVDDSEIEAAEVKADQLAGELQEMNKEDVLVKMNIDTSSGDKNQIAPQVQNVDVSKVNETLGNIENPTVTFDGNTAAFDTKAKHVKVEMTTIDALRANPVINASVNGLGMLNALASAIRNLHDKTVTINTRRTGDKVKGGTVTELYGTAHARGTAYATHGDWGAKKDETALVGELGSELRVRGSRWDLLGENGTEFADIHKGDIIFSAQQTEELLKYGKILNGKRRGKALASGTAYARPNAGGGGSSLNFVKEIADRVAKAVNGGGKKSSGGNSGGGNKGGNKGKGRKKGSSGKSTKKKSNSSSLEIFDWIELKIETIEREIKKLDITAQSVFKDWETRGSSLADEISKVTEEIDVQRQAIKKYKNDGDVKKTFKDFKVDYKTNNKGKNRKKKNKANRKKNKKNKSRNKTLHDYMEIIDEGGEIDIDSIKDDKLAEKVRNYQEWITKSREAEVAVDELTEKLAELNNQKFDNAQKKFEDMISTIEHEADMLEAKLNKNKYLGNVKKVSDNSIVDSQIKNEQKNYDKLVKEYKELDAIRKENVKKGYLIEGSEEWYKQQKELDDITLKEEQSLNKLRDLQKQKFENIKSSFETQISDIQKSANFINESLNQVQQRGFLASKQFYKDLMANEQSQMKLLEKERDQLIAQTNAAVKSDRLKVGSEEWIAQQNAIDEISLSLEQANTQLIEYANNIRDIDWQVFDMIRDEVNDTINESEFLIDLLSNKDLFEDNGQFTKQGMATLGSRSVNYNLQMAQADAYRDEMLKIQEELNKAENKGNKTLIDRKKELLKLQQDSIKNAEQEKEAIKSLVKEGIEKELESLKKLIDKQTELLDKEKSQYDYQKRIKDHTKDISSLEKQLAALSGDDSEAARSKRQKLEAQLKEAKDTLQETTYDQYVSDQKDMLDDLYDQYDEVLNKRLDNVDALIADMIKTTNENASSIRATLEEESTKVGYKITTDLTNIWAEGGKER